MSVLDPWRGSERTAACAILASASVLEDLIISTASLAFSRTLALGLIRKKALYYPRAMAHSSAERFVREIMSKNDASHDSSHVIRVRNLALELAKEEGLTSDSSLSVIELAALLHDVGKKYFLLSLDRLSLFFQTITSMSRGTVSSMREFQNSPLLVSSSEQNRAKEFLDNEGFDNDTKHRVLSIIKSMGFKEQLANGAVGQSPELAVVQDADRLDAIGAIGIARCFTYGGSRNHILHDASILPVLDGMTKEEYTRKDRRHTMINHFYEKLLKLKDLMKTEAGRNRAEKRHEFMEAYLAEFLQEWEGFA
ncbi:uncharacterized protein LOC9646052 isoform X1 [Selaginella moellendorffii]|uniref:uncharacterized protein LOC9646052 isoform X1 n=1 Tax=Selaginella moellendorffii TaxID=88036 RepID=UPI000D1CDA3B|nr:uncharacterized protein LOC9646052 isoform X1 [Selaginella moellendorffii]|eukprot:XP_024530592.1 uncharacterized protein LOC9646052 isoform X1 [Selaginella moellendorffii]